MKITIVSGTNRKGSNTLIVSKKIQEMLGTQNEVTTEVINLEDIPLEHHAAYGYSSPHSDDVQQYVNKINGSDGVIVVCPEYNGSYPGILKYFIDHLSYPDSFEYRPVAFVGLGGKFGGLRPVEHLQQVFGYRNAFIFPIRVFLFNVWNIVKNGQIEDQESLRHLSQLVEKFPRFIKGLMSQDLLSKKA